MHSFADATALFLPQSPDSKSNQIKTFTMPTWSFSGCTVVLQFHDHINYVVFDNDVRQQYQNGSTIAQASFAFSKMWCHDGLSSMDAEVNVPVSRSWSPGTIVILTGTFEIAIYLRL